MRFHVLGPLRVFDGDRLVSLGGTNQRAALGYLLLHTGKVVAVSKLLEALWGEHAPPTARKIVQNAISSLRRTLVGAGGGRGTLVTEAPGYLLRADPTDVDLLRFRDLVAAGRAALDSGRWDEADRHYGGALALWTGPALADLAEEGYNWPELAALKNAKLTALESRMEAALAAGRHMEIIAELEALVEAAPLRERLCRQLMLALYRAGRQADALAVYRRTRAALVGQLGLEPGPELRDLERAILDHDPALLPDGGAAVRGGGSAARENSADGTGRDRVIDPGPPTHTARWRYFQGVELKPVSAVLMRIDTGHSPVQPEMLLRQVDVLESSLRQVVRRYGGREHGRLGSVLVALFGTDRTREDDAQRAVHAAMTISRQWHELTCLRVAVVTGDALVVPAGSGPAAGDGGGPLVIGQLLDEGMALLFTCDPESVRICARTRQICADHLDFGPVGDPEITVRRGQHPTVWPDVPFMQRERELRHLCEALEDVRRRRRPHLVTMLGEAGIGKSRLMCEFRKVVDDSAGVRCLVGRNRYFGQEPYASLAEVIRCYIGVADEDPDAERDRKLRDAVTALMGSGRISAQVTENLSRMLAERPGGADDETADFSAVFAAWRRFIEELAGREPLVVILEDFDRGDDMLLRFVGGLVETVGNVPLLIVVTARPELVDRAAFWTSARRRTTTMSLEPLSRSAIRTLFKSLAATRSDERLAELCLGLAGQVGGNPLFAMEYVRAAQAVIARSGRGHGHPDASPDEQIPVPYPVYNVISARLDALPVVEKAVLYDAAVFGASFSYEALAALGDRDAVEVRKCLESLERHELIRRYRLGPELGKIEYSFVHDLVARVACSRLPHGVRSDKHRRAAEWLLSVGDRPMELLVRHWREAVRHAELGGESTEELKSLAVHRLTAAGRQAAGRGSPQAARYLYRAALDLCPACHPLRPQLLPHGNLPR